jgi:hypothetical protein
MKSRAEIGIERPDVLLAPTVGNRSDCRDIGEDFADRVDPEHDRVGGSVAPLPNAVPLLIFYCDRLIENSRQGPPPRHDFLVHF